MMNLERCSQWKVCLAVVSLPEDLILVSSLISLLPLSFSLRQGVRCQESLYGRILFPVLQGQDHPLVSKGEWSAECWSRDCLQCSSQQESQIPKPLYRARTSVCLGGQKSLVSPTDKLASSCHRWVNLLSGCPLPQRLHESYFPRASFVARPYCLTCLGSYLDLCYRRDLHKAPVTASRSVDWAQGLRSSRMAYGIQLLFAIWDPCGFGFLSPGRLQDMLEFAVHWGSLNISKTVYHHKAFSLLLTQPIDLSDFCVL